jgi:integrase
MGWPTSSRPFIFVTERGGPLTRSTVNKLVERAGRNAEIEFPVHPHMLRHACGYYLANKGVDNRMIAESTPPSLQFSPPSSYGVGRSFQPPCAWLLM